MMHFWHFWLIYALLSQNVVVANHALLPQMFFRLKTKICRLFTFRMYAYHIHAAQVKGHKKCKCANYFVWWLKMWTSWFYDDDHFHHHSDDDDNGRKLSAVECVGWSRVWSKWGGSSRLEPSKMGRMMMVKMIHYEEGGSKLSATLCILWEYRIKS